MPANTPHVDQTLEGGFRRAKRHMTAAEAEKYLDGNWRIRIVNVWRPLSHVQNDPLALCDPATVHPTDLIAVDRVSPEYVGEVYYLNNHPDQQWYWLSDQSPDEACLFLSFDSAPTGRAAFCPHASFHLAGREGSEARRSVEVRAIVVG
ncbi:hypothetical protein ASPSYDRAFT_51938 [Aspergillus sydowii CBS 593.65]|uniref:Uncharacterized protein n=1 Tax=Aspergillus sydowii CBS 593.65 TaxID=1036612 RepID=A0A1L9SZA2_9EURO|nr:uncharacterized protein ASPSYDRAFT_51938 [Aspergillus sydowii CBS 593.65]OJJ52520.1 hypothetical protein ASPSYDRAFT_51938 [Aspergillus sydowii CBS 593.65]